MVILWVCQAAFGLAALAACLFAVRSVLRHQRTLSYYLTLSGAFALIFFLAVPGSEPETILISLLAIATGALLMPSENQRSTHELLDDEFEIGDSTLTRRLKK
ncbi:MAG TPA: hypothetical protein VF980_18240 [Thermoanaerobaculia bacterium]